MSSSDAATGAAGVPPVAALPRPEGWTDFALLEGVRVLDLTNSIAGPYATLLLGDLGADVVKVERPGAGDDTRSWGPPFLDGESLWYLSANRNKSSIALDLGAPESRGTLEGLLRAADVVVVNLRPEVQQRLRVDARAVQQLRPDTVHCSITGFGLSGRRRNDACYDLIAEGHSGVMDLTGDPDGAPQKVGTPAADLLAGMDAAFGIVAALLDRDRRGRGHVLDVSLTESMTRFLGPRLVTYLGSGELPRRSGGRDSVIAVYQVFDAADRPLTLALGNDRIFARFCAAVERDDWADDPRYRDNRGRREHRDELVAEIQRLIARRPRAHWLALFGEREIPAGPINTLADVVADPDLLERGAFFAIRADDGSAIPQVATGWHLDGSPNGRARRPPALGADTDEVLTRWSVPAPPPPGHGASNGAGARPGGRR